MLLDAGADVNAKYGSDETALHIAASKNQPEIMLALLAKNADVNLQRADGETALHVAAKHNYHRSVQALLESGAEVGLKNKDGQTALMLALQGARDRKRDVKKTVRMLLGYGGGSTTKEGDKRYVLAIAVKSGDKVLVSVLSSYFSDTELRWSLEYRAYAVCMWVKGMN